MEQDEEKEGSASEEAQLSLESMRGVSYLERRVEHLLDLLREEKLKFVADIKHELARDLYNIQRHPNGRINLATCTPLVRSVARSLYGMRDVLGEEQGHAQGEDKPETRSSIDPVHVQRELFGILDEFLRRFTGEDPAKFATANEYLSKYKEKGEGFVTKTFTAAMQFLEDSLNEFHRNNIFEIPEAARNQGGIKLVTGGAQRFPPAAARAVRSMLLYTDTLLIPDPVLPWLEVERREEQFPIINMVKAAFEIVTFKSLIDADLPYPAILAVPTLERRLTIESEVTQDLLSRSILEFFSLHLDEEFEDESEIFEYARARQKEFLDIVDRKRLFYPPEGNGTESAPEAITIYMDHIRRNRAPWYQEKFSRLSDGEMVVNGILERLEPQFHLKDNAEWLRAQPMLWLDPHWHYFKLCAGVSEFKLRRESIVTEKTLATIRALNTPGFEWLGNVPLESLVELRQRNENESFRRKLQEYTGALHKASLDEIDKVASEVSRGLASLMAEHQNEVRRIEAKYNRQYKVTASISWITLAAQFLPWLFPGIPALPAAVGSLTPLALASQYLKDKIPERDERKEASRTLTGVLAAARG